MQTAEVMEIAVLFCGLVCVTYAEDGKIFPITLLCVFLSAAILQRLIPLQDISRATTWKFRQKASTGLVAGAILLPMAFVAHGSPRCREEGVPWTCYHPLTVLTASITLLLAVTVGRNVLARLRDLLSSSYALAGAHIGCYILMKLCGPSLVRYMVAGGIMALVFLCHLMSSLPNSFTIGEAMLIAQWLTILALESITSSPSTMTDSSTFGACLRVLVVGSMTAAFLLRPVYSRIYRRTFGTPDRTLEERSWTWSAYFYFMFAGVNIFFLLPWLGILIRENPVIYGLRFMFASEDRIWLMFAWILLVTVAVSVVAMTTASSTVVRKYFHLIAVATFIPGLLYDPELLCLASAGVFFIFIVLEGVRVLRIKPFGGFLHEAFQVFVDERDSGLLTLTHIYLLVGLSLPIWIYSGGHYLKSGLFLPLFSGVLSIGVGDTAASVIGSKVGTHKWPGTNKTVEGTTAAIVSQVICCHLLQVYLGIVPTGSQLQTLLTIIFTSLLEAFTDQIDNIILPIFMFSILSVEL